MTAAPGETQDTSVISQLPKDLSSYTVDSSSIDDNARNLLINYSGIPAEEVGPHVDAIVSFAMLCNIMILIRCSAKRHLRSWHIRASECIDFWI